MLRNHARLAAAALIASLVLPLAGCASGGKKTRADTRYVARDVNTLYNPPRSGCDQRRLCRRRRRVRRGRAPASLFGLGAPRAADERLQLLCRQAIIPSRSNPPRRFLSIHPGNRDAPYALLSDRAQLLRADQRRHPRPGDHPAGARRARRARPPLSRHALRRRRPAQDRPRPRPSRRQGDGDRPLLPAPRASGSPR